MAGDNIDMKVRKIEFIDQMKMYTDHLTSSRTSFGKMSNLNTINGVLTLPPEVLDGINVINNKSQIKTTTKGTTIRKGKSPDEGKRYNKDGGSFNKKDNKDNKDNTEPNNKEKIQVESILYLLKNIPNMINVYDIDVYTFDDFIKAIKENDLVHIWAEKGQIIGGLTDNDLDTISETVNHNEIDLLLQGSKGSEYININAGSDIDVPRELADHMIKKLPKKAFKHENSLLEVECGDGELSLAYLRRVKELGNDVATIKIVIQDSKQFNVDLTEKRIKKEFSEITNVVKFKGDILSNKYVRKMKFDVIVGNPPYQEVVGNKTTPMWHKIVMNSFELLKDDGDIAMVHPGTWRKNDGMYKKIHSFLKNKQINYLELHDFKDGAEMFGVGTSFDWYTAKNTQSVKPTKVKFQDNSVFDLNLNELDFIPNGMYKKISSLIASNVQERVNILHSRTSYGNDRPNMSKVKNEEYSYECVYTITKKEGINLMYSSTDKNGHFGIPKVIWSNGSGTYPVIDKEGKYGLTNFSAGIIDDVEVLPLIKKALESKEFLEIMSYVKFMNSKYDHKIISLFRKDFWKEFV